MPDISFEFDKSWLLGVLGSICDLDQTLKHENAAIYFTTTEHTFGSHPTTQPPPIPLPFQIEAGKFAQRATTG